MPERLKNKVAIARIINAEQDNDYESSLFIADAILDEVPPTREQIMADPRVMALVEAAREARPYVPDHHGPIVYRIDTALAALTDNEGETE